jgi:1,4-alpha-glucan branching enzyme
LDGFRFANVTNSLYLNHGVGLSSNLQFTQYFSDNANFKGQAYFMLANEITHQIYPEAISIAEEFTGYPTLCFSVNDGGLGFDYY